jgi:hypothetical protein
VKAAFGIGLSGTMMIVIVVAAHAHIGVETCTRIANATNGCAQLGPHMHQVHTSQNGSMTILKLKEYAQPGRKTSVGVYSGCSIVHQFLVLALTVNGRGVAITIPRNAPTGGRIAARTLSGASLKLAGMATCR